MNTASRIQPRGPIEGTHIGPIEGTHIDSIQGTHIDLRTRDMHRLENDGCPGTRLRLAIPYAGHASTRKGQIRDTHRIEKLDVCPGRLPTPTAGRQPARGHASRGRQPARGHASMEKWTPDTHRITAVRRTAGPSRRRIHAEFGVCPGGVFAGIGVCPRVYYSRFSRLPHEGEIIRRVGIEMRTL
jgi:hypothetical protein